MGRNSGGVRVSKTDVASISVKQIYKRVNNLNADHTLGSKYANYRDGLKQQIADETYAEVKAHLPKESLAMKIKDIRDFTKSQIKWKATMGNCISVREKRKV